MRSPTLHQSRCYRRHTTRRPIRTLPNKHREPREVARVVPRPVHARGTVQAKVGDAVPSAGSVRAIGDRGIGDRPGQPHSAATPHADAPRTSWDAGAHRLAIREYRGQARDHRVTSSVGVSTAPASAASARRDGNSRARTGHITDALGSAQFVAHGSRAGEHHRLPATGAVQGDRV